MTLARLLLRPAGWLLFVAFLQAAAGPLIRASDRLMYDAVLRWSAFRRAAPAPQYVLVEIDESSIERLGRFPWERGAYARLLDRTTEGRARVVAFDVLLTEAGDPEGDAQLVAAIERAGNVVLGSAAALARPGEVPEGAGPLGRLRAAERLLEPLPAFANAAAGVGSLTLLEDDDGALRRYPVLLRFHDRPYPSLAQVLAERAEFTSDLPVSLARDGSVLINWGVLSPEAVARISFADALELSRADAMRVFSDRIVLVGATYEGGVDAAPTPLATRTPGSYAHLYATETLRTGRTIVDGGLLGALILALLSIGILAGKVGEQRPVRVAILAVLAVLVLLVGAAVLLGYARISLAPSLAALAVLAFVGIAGLTQWWESARARGRAEALLGRFLDARVRSRALSDLGLPRSDATEVDVSVLSLRLPNLWDVTSGLGPGGRASVVRRVHRACVEVVERHVGVVDHLRSDGLMACWGLGKESGESTLAASRAVETAGEIRAALLRISDELAPTLQDRLRLRMGVATGQAILAEVGAEGLSDITLLGPLVGMAERLRDTAPLDGVHICERTARAAADVLPGTPFPQPPLEVDGMDGPVGTFLLERPYRPWVDRSGRDPGMPGDASPRSGDASARMEEIDPGP